MSDLSIPPASASPVAPRLAASLLVVRQGPTDAEVLMGLRGAGHRFMPNKLVFPGGAVDAEDYHAPVASPLADPVLRRFAPDFDPAAATATAVAAARELEEETGLSLGRPPHLRGIDYLCRAVTPAAQPIRFDARFFVVDAAESSGALAGSGELEGLQFYSLTAAAALDLVFVTRAVIEQLRGWLTWTPDERQRRARVPTMMERSWQTL